TLAILTTSLSNPAYATESLLLGMLANIVFVTIEARRFRFFDVWRGRVRMIEENFYGGILRRDQVSPQDLWGSHVADDLLCPRFHLTQIQAFRARLMRNFRYIFIFLLGAWLTNRFSPLTERAHTGINAFPEWVTDSLVGVIYLSLILIAVFTPKVIAPEVAYWGDPDHPGEMISSLDV
ncbi:MAG: putative membrane protein, partial [Candidatus Krumholzibacteriia bacterium]